MGCHFFRRELGSRKSMTNKSAKGGRREGSGRRALEGPMNRVLVSLRLDQIHRMDNERGESTRSQWIRAKLDETAEDNLTQL